MLTIINYIIYYSHSYSEHHILRYVSKLDVIEGGKMLDWTCKELPKGMVGKHLSCADTRLMTVGT
jgi:hypothetical protein